MTTNPIRVLQCGLCPFQEANSRQKRIREGVARGTMPETILILEHPPVITRGRGDDGTQLRRPEEVIVREGIPVLDVERGGGATYHGPGQVVAYPVVRLSRFQNDIHRYLRVLEGVMIQVCRNVGVNAHRREGLTGVWVEDRKIAFLGVAVRGYVTFHGLSLNVLDVKQGFQWIDPCGLRDVIVTSLQEEGASVAPSEVAEKLEETLLAACEEDECWLGQPIPLG